MREIPQDISGEVSQWTSIEITKIISEKLF